jgi:hypothetical protein
MRNGYPKINRSVQKQICRLASGGNFEDITGIPGVSFAGVLRNSNRVASLFFTHIALEERVKEWAQKLNRAYPGLHFQPEILDFDSYCAVFQTRHAGRAPQTLTLFDYIRQNKQEIFGQDPIYEGVQFRAYGNVFTEVDFVAPGMIVKVDEPLRQKTNRSHHRKRKHSSLYKANSFLENNNYPHCREVRLEGIPFDDETWEIALYDICNQEYFSIPKASDKL